MRFHKERFHGKIVFCNCDDPYESSFFKYFAMNFNFLGLKKLIATCYSGSSVAGDELPLFYVPGIEVKTETEKHSYKIEITEVKDENHDGAVDLADVEYLLKNRKNVLSLLSGNGDFRSPECIALLKEADIVVTNPPFSLFREYVALLVAYEKDFLVIGNVNAVTCKEIFPLIQENKMWMGASIHSGDRKFFVPSDYPLNAAGCGMDEGGLRYIRVKGVRWFTNIDYARRHENLVLYKIYHGHEEEYPKYDQYNAINVNKTSDIPIDYFEDCPVPSANSVCDSLNPGSGCNGIMGVPITFLDKYNPEQFEILGLDRYVGDNPHYGHRFKINGKETYARILIRWKGLKNEN